MRKLNSRQKLALDAYYVNTGCITWVDMSKDFRLYLMSYGDFEILPQEVDRYLWDLENSFNTK
jgi:hypothetical protein